MYLVAEEYLSPVTPFPQSKQTEQTKQTNTEKETMFFNPFVSIAVGAAVATTPLGWVSGAAIGLAMLLARSNNDPKQFST